MLSHPSGSINLTRADGLVLIADTPKGRGVFASKPIPRGTTIEVSPVLLLTPQEVQTHTSRTCLHHYTYYWPLPDGSQTQALALGLGSMFNHSTLRQNVVWVRDVPAQAIVYTAHREIAAGEELCISYGHARLWFKDADAVDEGDVYAQLEARNGHVEDDGLALAGFGELEINDEAQAV